nr:hypothetical protein CFP56_03809 [Quercus suber]
MLTRLAQRLAHLLQPVLHLHVRPAEDAGEEGHGPAFHAFLPVEQVPAPDLLEPRVRTPGPDRPLEDPLLDLGEAGGLDQAGHLLRDLKRLARALARLHEVAAPAREHGVIGQRLVDAVAVHAPFNVLDVAARRQVGEALSVEVRPVGDAAKQPAQVDEVEVVGRVDPETAAVVDLERDVARLHAGRDGREVSADDFGVGELVGNIARGRIGYASSCESVNRDPVCSLTISESCARKELGTFAQPTIGILIIAAMDGAAGQPRRQPVSAQRGLCNEFRK